MTTIKSNRDECAIVEKITDTATELRKAITSVTILRDDLIDLIKDVEDFDREKRNELIESLDYFFEDYHSVHVSYNEMLEELRTAAYRVISEKTKG